MGLFGYNYNKEGPGVDKDAPEKRRFIRFFELFSERFWNLSGLNLIFLLCVLVPAISAFGVYFLTKNIQVALIPLIAVTIPLCGMTLVTSKYVREESVFMWADFFEAMKENWLKALFVGIFDYAFVALMTYILPVYWNLAQKNNFYYVFFLIAMTFCLVFLFMQFYIYIMIVLFDIDIKAVFKNSLIFAIVNIWINLLVAVVILIITVICMYMLELIETPLLGGVVIVLICLIVFSAFSFFTNFAIWPKVKELMGVKDAFEEEIENDLPVDDGNDDGEYVFENGKMVKKSKK